MKYRPKTHRTLAGYFEASATPRAFLRLFAGQEWAILDERRRGMRDAQRGVYAPPVSAVDRRAYEAGWKGEHL